MTEQNSDLNATLNRLMAVIVRRRWWILVTTCVISLAVVRASFLLPNRYRSEATIFVANARVPQQYIVPNNTANTMEAVDAITHQVLSRARLMQIIIDFGLYQGRRQMGIAALADLMRNDIEVQPTSKDPERRSVNAFMIAYTGDNARVAQQVTDRLTSLFIKESQQTQEDLDTGTTSFLQQEMEHAKTELDKQEAVLKDYKIKNLGELPEQNGANLEVLSGLQMQLQAADANLARARQQRTYLQAMLAPYTQLSSNHVSQESSGSGSLAAMREELARLRSQRDDLLSHYSSLYPDVVNLNQRIANVESRLNHLASSPAPAPDRAKKEATFDEMNIPLDPAAIQLRSQLEANAMEIDDVKKQSEQLRSRIAVYQNRLTLAPVRQQQLQEVMSNYESAKQNYADLLNKETQSELATKLAMQQRGEQYQVIDPASLPMKPFSPKRDKIALGGLAAGLFAGLGLAFLIDTRDRSFHFENDIRGFLAVPLVVGVPLLPTSVEKKKLARRTRLEWTVGSLLLLTILAVQLYMFRQG